MTPLVLGMLAVLGAGPVPALMARSGWLRRTPFACLVLWQAVALAAVLAALGAGVSLASNHAWRPGASSAPDAVSWVVVVVAVSVTGLVLARLLWTGHRVGTELRALRRRHRDQLDLVARHEAGMDVLEHDRPVAYCLPGVHGSRVVLSEGALGRLDEAQLAAVLAHERAHLRARHDLVLEAFSVLHRAFPRWVSSGRALGEVRWLVEALADAAAVRRTDRRALLEALVSLAGSRTPEAALGVAEGGLAQRAALLGDRREHRLQSAILLATAVLVLALPTLLVVWPWLRGLA